jgi:hypothetical protein
MIDRGVLAEEIKSIEDIPKDKREELIVSVKTMLLKSNLSLQEAMQHPYSPTILNNKGGDKS